MEFYSYLWLREDGTPFYVGKGSGKRAYIRHGKFYPPKDHALIVILPRASETEAFATEIELIRNWGRKDIGTGCLYNRTDGGENPPKRQKGTFRWSEEQKLKLSEARIGKPILKARGLKRSEETKQRMRKPRSYTWTLSEETKQAQSTAAVVREAKKKEQGIHCGQVFGYQHTKEARQKISNAKKGKPSWNRGIPQTPEHRAKLSTVRKGKNKGKPRPSHVLVALHSSESIAKSAASRTGLKRSAEAKQNMKIAALIREEKKSERKNNHEFQWHTECFNDDHFARNGRSNASAFETPKFRKCRGHRHAAHEAPCRKCPANVAN